MAILDSIEQIPAKQRWLLVGIIFLALIGGFWHFVYKKKTSQIQILETKLSNLNSELQDLRAIQKKLGEFKGMIAELEAQLEVAQRQLPRQKDIPKLLNDISEFGKKSGLEFLSFRPTKEGVKGFYAEVPINLVINGPFHNIATFIDAIVHYPRIIKITNLKLGTPKDMEGQLVLRATMQATTYRYLEESEEAGEGKKGGKAKKKGKK